MPTQLPFALLRTPERRPGFATSRRVGDFFLWTMSSVSIHPVKVLR
jgi:hypothetical protein